MAKNTLYPEKQENGHTPLFETIVEAIRENTKDEQVRGIWINGDDKIIITATAAQANAIADLFDAVGYDTMGDWAVRFDAQAAEEEE